MDENRYHEILPVAYMAAAFRSGGKPGRSGSALPNLALVPARAFQCSYETIAQNCSL